MKNKILSLKLHIKRIGFLATLSYLAQRKIKKNGTFLKVKVRGLMKKVLLRNGSYDTHIFHQIFIREEVNFRLPFIPKIIIDCGANIGLSTLYFKSIYPKCLILSFEPELTNYQLLCLNTKGYQGIKPYHAAIWHEKTHIHVIDNGEGNASFQTFADNKKNAIETIQALTLSDIITENGFNYIDLIKIDIEGSEFEIFAHSSESWIDKSNVIAVEIHESLKPGVTNLIESKLNEKFIKKQIGEYAVFFKS